MLTRRMSKALPAICIAFALLITGLVVDTRAQGDDDNQMWSPPISLYEMPTDSYDPAIVADPSGRVHVFWGESINTPGSVGNMIMYTSWDGQSWSAPTDILIAPDGVESRSWQPAPAVSSSGRLHLAWTGGFAGNIYYSSARADEATLASAWSKPIELSFVADAGSPHMVIDDQGIIHVAFTVPNGLDQGIYYLRSEDDGHTWSYPEVVPDSHIDPEAYVRNGRLAVSKDGTIHVAWWWMTDEFPPKGVMYVRSIDDGSTWSDLLSMEGPFQELDVAAVGTQEVHLVWSSTVPERYKWYRHSQDGGLTWMPAAKWPQLGGFHGWTGMTLDSDEVLHLGIVASHYGIHEMRDEALLHMQWDGYTWSEPEIVLLNAPIEEENQKNAAIAISEGNLVHLVVQYPLAADQKRPYQYDIYYSRRRLDSMYVAPQPLPAATPTPAPTVPPSKTSVAQSIRTPTPRPIVLVATAPPQSFARSTSANPGFSTLMGIMPALAVLAGVVLIHLGRNGRR